MYLLVLHDFHGFLKSSLSYLNDIHSGREPVSKSDRFSYTCRMLVNQAILHIEYRYRNRCIEHTALSNQCKEVLSWVGVTLTVSVS